MFLKELNFLLREGCHGDGFDSVRWIQSSAVGGEMKKRSVHLEDNVLHTTSLPKL